MKALTFIWAMVLVTVVGGLLWLNVSINHMVRAAQEPASYTAPLELQSNSLLTGLTLDSAGSDTAVDFTGDSQPVFVAKLVTIPANKQNNLTGQYLQPTFNPARQ